MKRTSIFSAVLVTTIVLGVPTVAWSQFNPDVSSDGDITETVTPSHQGRHGGHGGHCGCW